MRSLVFLFLSFLALSAHSEWTSYRNISVIKAMDDGGVVINLVGFDGGGTSANCGSNSFIIKSSEVGFETKYTAVLSAHMAGRKVKFSFYGCDGDKFKVFSAIIPNEM